MALKAKKIGANTRGDFMAPVDGCHCITHYPLLVWTVFGGMHIQTACSTEIQFEVTNNLTTSVAWCVCDFMSNSSGKLEACKPELIPKQPQFWFHHSFEDLLSSWLFYFKEVFFFTFLRQKKHKYNVLFWMEWIHNLLSLRCRNSL